MYVCTHTYVCGQHRASQLGWPAFHSNEASAAAMCWMAGLPEGRMVRWAEGPKLHVSVYQFPLSTGCPAAWGGSGEISPIFEGHQG